MRTLDVFNSAEVWLMILIIFIIACNNYTRRGFNTVRAKDSERHTLYSIRTTSPEVTPVETQKKRADGKMAMRGGRSRDVQSTCTRKPLNIIQHLNISSVGASLAEVRDGNCRQVLFSRWSATAEAT